MEIAHLCHNPCCVNPGHLVAVSHAENMAISVRIGTFRGEKNGKSKLKNEQVYQVKGWDFVGLPIKHIFALLGINKSSVYGIVKGSIWRHISGPIGFLPVE